MKQTQNSFLLNEHVWVKIVGSVLIISTLFIPSWSCCLQLALYFTSWNCIVFPSAFWLSFSKSVAVYRTRIQNLFDTIDAETLH